MDIIWYMFDMIGTVAFAVSGALVGVSRKMDIFGMAVLALATAIGGGVIRDVLLGCRICYGSSGSDIHCFCDL